MKVVTWNVNNQSSDSNWLAIGPGGAYECDIALLNEARRPPEGLGLRVMTRGRTIGRDDVTYGGKKQRAWATAVASRYALARPRDVWALGPSPKDPGKDRRSKLMTSRRGAWTAGVVSFPNGEQVTVIAIYGLLDERSDASVHRSLSDLTPLLDDKRYNRLLLLGGDLNPLWSTDPQGKRFARVQGVFDRITHGFGLKDLLRQTLDRDHPVRGRLENCTCSLGEECRHTWTYRKHRSSTRACQDDYLFASPAMATRLEECIAVEFTDESPSDHAPIVATFGGFD